MIPYLNQIVTGDARELIHGIPDESVDLIFCDPVYDRVEDYRWLAEEASRVLKPDRACLAWTSKRKAARCQIAMEDGGLEFVYALDYVVPGKFTMLNYYHMFTWTTPCLWMQKGRSLPRSWIPDTIISYATKGGNHKWNKNPEAFVKWLLAFSEPDALVLDPFAGGGTVPAVCKTLGRNFIGFEIDPATAIAARQRVADTSFPLPGVDWEGQLTLEEAP